MTAAVAEVVVVATAVPVAVPAAVVVPVAVLVAAVVAAATDEAEVRVVRVSSAAARRDAEWEASRFAARSCSSNSRMRRSESACSAMTSANMVLAPWSP